MLFVSISVYVSAHEEPLEEKHPTSEKVHEIGNEPGYESWPKNWSEWIGNFHFILLHFPIALINMIAVAEILFYIYHTPIFDFSSRFMLIAAAVLAPVTALLGYILSLTEPYVGIFGTFLLLHMWSGIGAACLTLVLIPIREFSSGRKLYYYLLAVLVTFINLTSFLGGEMTFGPYHMFPPTN